MISKRIGFSSSLLVLLSILVSGCVLAPREGYYDHYHHRYYHDHAWHQCVPHDVHCH